MRYLVMLATLLPLTLLHAQEYAEPLGPLVINGRVTDGENKMDRTEIVTFQGNEQQSSTTTDKSGKFHLELALQENYSLEFRHEGFVAKRIAVDTHMPRPKAEEEFEIVPILMDVSMLERQRYDGANTDDLDFPFAMVRFDRKIMAFTQDLEYTMGMQRVNGALLLMAARADKN